MLSTTQSTRFAFSFIPRLLVILAALALCCPSLNAQQTLGGITGSVKDNAGAMLPGTVVTAVDEETQLTRVQNVNKNGTYEFVNLPIGRYTLTFVHDAFESEKVPSITVQADRTATVNVTLKIGQVGTTVTVQASPLINAVDTTNGYIMERDQVESVPLPTGSFTGFGNPLAWRECGTCRRHRRQ